MLKVKQQALSSSFPPLPPPPFLFSPSPRTISVFFFPRHRDFAGEGVMVMMEVGGDIPD